MLSKEQIEKYEEKAKNVFEAATKTLATIVKETTTVKDGEAVLIATIVLFAAATAEKDDNRLDEITERISRILNNDESRSLFASLRNDYMAMANELDD